MIEYKPTEEHARILARDPGRHDALPWSQGTANGADGHAVCSGAHVVATVLGGGYPVAKGWAPNSYANAALIVRAVNSHAALVEALESLFEHCAMIHKHWGEGCNQREASEAIAKGRAALILAGASPQVIAT